MSSDSGTAVVEFAELADPYRRELLAHCYRMLGSYQDAEDLVQETLMRAWRGYDRFDGRSSLRTWLHRIATNACLSALASADRRILPSGLGGPTDSEQPDMSRVEATPWLQPAPTAGLIGEADDPAAIVALRDSTRLALIAAYQVLPARQRAALLLVDVATFTRPRSPTSSTSRSPPCEACCSVRARRSPAICPTMTASSPRPSWTPRYFAGI